MGGSMDIGPDDKTPDKLTNENEENTTSDKETIQNEEKSKKNYKKYNKTSYLLLIFGISCFVFFLLFLLSIGRTSYAMAQKAVEATNQICDSHLAYAKENDFRFSHNFSQEYCTPYDPQLPSNEIQLGFEILTKGNGFTKLQNALVHTFKTGIIFRSITETTFFLSGYIQDKPDGTRIMLIPRDDYFALEKELERPAEEINCSLYYIEENKLSQHLKLKEALIKTLQKEVDSESQKKAQDFENQMEDYAFMHAHIMVSYYNTTACLSR